MEVFNQKRTPLTGSATASGDTPMHAPAAGKTILLRYYRLTADSAVTNQVVATLKIGSLVIDAGPLVANQQIATDLRDDYVAASADDVLTLNLDGAQKVWWVVRYDEV